MVLSTDFNLAFEENCKNLEMEEDKIELLDELQPSVTAVAISGSKKSKNVVKWALDNFVPEGHEVYFKLLHIRPLISIIQTPMGKFIPISQARDEVAAAFRKKVERQVTEKLLPYKKLFPVQVQVEIVQIESDDVASALSIHIRKHRIDKLVIGASSATIFSRPRTLSSKISESCSSFCAVYAVSKGKLASLRPSDSETNRKIRDDSSDTSSIASHTLSSQTDWTGQSSMGSLAHFRSSSSGIMNSRNSFLDINDKSSHVSRSSLADNRSRDEASSFDTSDYFELEKLIIELRHNRGMYAVAQGDQAIDASRKLNELEKRSLEEEINLKEITHKEEEAKETQNLENALAGSFHQYRIFTWDEIISATSSFSDDLKIGMGAYGTVYKCSFHHTLAAVKVVHAKERSITKQFQHEVEILSRIRHPHVLTLIGACPERDCLVYEFMENGSLEDCLFRKNNTPPLPWFHRYRIAYEVASALVFLHASKPNAIVHRDLKPDNILLDRNYVAKIGDIGLATMVDQDSFSTALVGTLWYIDPEYQRTGVVSPKSDIYAFGMVVLQLVTAKQANGLAHAVEKAVEEGRLVEVIDVEGGDWPVEETKDLVQMALKCTEIRRRDRPDLRDEVLLVLEKMKDVALRARDLALVAVPRPPSHFTCPILKEVMGEPCVAGDGYTYDREAIEAWLEEKDTSPVTNLPLPHKILIPNYTLLSAITEWKSGN